jgi:hypothetical protein
VLGAVPLVDPVEPDDEPVPMLAPAPPPAGSPVVAGGVLVVVSVDGAGLVVAPPPAAPAEAPVVFVMSAPVVPVEAALAFAPVEAMAEPDHQSRLARSRGEAFI